MSILCDLSAWHDQHEFRLVSSFKKIPIALYSSGMPCRSILSATYCFFPLTSFPFLFLSPTASLHNDGAAKKILLSHLCTIFCTKPAFGFLQLMTQIVFLFSPTLFTITQRFHKVLLIFLQTKTAADLHIGAIQTVFIALRAVKGQVLPLLKKLLLLTMS